MSSKPGCFLRLYMTLRWSLGCGAMKAGPWFHLGLIEVQWVILRTKECWNRKGAGWAPNPVPSFYWWVNWYLEVVTHPCPHVGQKKDLPVYLGSESSVNIAILKILCDVLGDIEIIAQQLWKKKVGRVNHPEFLSTSLCQDWVFRNIEFLFYSSFGCLPSFRISVW